MRCWNIIKFNGWDVRKRSGRLKWEVQGQGGGRILDLDGQGGGDWIIGLDNLKLDNFCGRHMCIVPYGVVAWLTNSCDTHIVQYFKKKRQSNNEIWSVDRT